MLGRVDQEVRRQEELSHGAEMWNKVGTGLQKRTKDCGEVLVGRSVGRLVGPHFTFFIFLWSLASLHLPKCSRNSNTAPAHPHAPRVAVYPALFLIMQLKFITATIRP